MSKPYKGFEPKWVKDEAPKNSYRSISRWGDPKFTKFPKESLYKVLKDECGLTDDDFKEYQGSIGFEKVENLSKPNIDKKHLKFFVKLLGNSNVSQKDYDRLSVAYGKTAYDLLRIKERRFDSLPDVVLYPKNSVEIQKIVDYVYLNDLPLYVYGGGSSVTRGVEPVKGGVSLDLRKHFNKVIKFNEVDQTITVQAGMSGPRLEEILNNAVKELGAKRAYTCGHFPQSFEYSSVGGWVVTRGAGQNSTYYGTIADIVLSQKYATALGEINTPHYPREATGPNLNQIMMGSEGAFGVLTEVTLKIFRYMPENRHRYSFMFKTWKDGMEAAREMMQCECGFSSVFRLSDQEETHMMMRLYNLDEGPFENILKTFGYKDMERCLFLGFTEGEAGFSRNVYRKIKKIARKHGGLSLTGYVCKSWEKGRFNDPYLRDTCLDFGVVIDTMECSVNWSNMEQVHLDVRKICKKRPNTIVTTHMSHVYPQGANLYFIFMSKFDKAEEFKKYHSSILDAILKSGASMSHHHGIGKMFGPWLESYVGEKEFGVFRALKEYFDPKHLMNPGGTIGLDTPKKDRHHK